MDLLSKPLQRDINLLKLDLRRSMGEVRKGYQKTNPISKGGKEDKRKSKCYPTAVIIIITAPKR